MATRWAVAIKQASASDRIVKSWETLRTAVATHQKLLAENGIGKNTSERDRVRVNARRVGLEAPLFADEAEDSFADIMGSAFKRRANVLKEQPPPAGADAVAEVAKV